MQSGAVRNGLTPSLPQSSDGVEEQLYPTVAMGRLNITLAFKTVDGSARLGPSVGPYFRNVVRYARVAHDIDPFFTTQQRSIRIIQ